MSRNSDFEKIYQAFMWRFCKDHTECAVGTSAYDQWLNKLGLDDTKPYVYPQETQEKFSWTKPYLQFLKEDEQAKYFKVEALFPLSSMNNNVYTKDELLQAARSLVGKTVDLNHTNEKLPEVTIYDAQYEDNCVECLLRVDKGSKALAMIEKGEILHPSIEADCLRGSEETPEGNLCKGLVFTGLALLTKDVLPGVPLTRIMPVETLVESFTVTGVTNLDEKGKEKPEAENKIQEPGQNAVASPPTSGTDAVGANSTNDTKVVNAQSPPRSVQEADWTTAYINELPNQSFAVIEPAYLDGKTDNKDCRHLPFKDKDGKVDLPHLRNALARMNQVQPVTDSITAADLRAKAQKVLIAAAKSAGVGNYEAMAYDEFRAELDAVKQRLGDLDALKTQIQALTDQIAKLTAKPEPAEPEPNTEKKPCLCVLTKEGFWARFHQLRGEGASKSEAFRLVSLEVIEASQKKSKSQIV